MTHFELIIAEIEARKRGDNVEAERLWALRWDSKAAAYEGRIAKLEGMLCSDCPPPDYPTDETRCDSCPRRH